MIKFLKYTLATFTGAILAMIFFTIVFVAVIAGLITMASGNKTTPIQSNSILVIKLDAGLQERVPFNPLQQLNLLGGDAPVSVFDALQAIDQARYDTNITGILLRVENVEASTAMIGELRQALLKFKRSGKFVISYADYYTQKAYYLASVSDKIYLNPEGVVEFKGVSASVMFYNQLLKKIGLEPEIIRHGKYKSAVEPFLQDSMGVANREQLTALVKSVWQNIRLDIAAQRKLSASQLDSVADELLVRNAETAVKYGLVDSLWYYDQVLDELRAKLNMKSNDKIPATSLADYISNMQSTKEQESISDFGSNHIAVIVAEGDIVPGEGGENSIGGNKYARVLREARQNDKVKAIVLRINSGGGSALASEVIWREAALAAKVKPLVVSMSGVAASGGYYIAAPAKKIFADANTITGSIGVFGMMFNAKKTLQNVGLSTDVVNSNKHADMPSFTRAMHNDEREIMGAEIDSIYQVFLKRVSEGRKISVAMVDSVAQGRVWSGSNAKEIRLIDTVGGFADALDYACRITDLSSSDLKLLPASNNPLEELIEQMGGKAKMSIIKEFLGSDYQSILNLRSPDNYKGVQCRLPFELQLK